MPPEILSKRPFRDEFGEMTIDEVNSLLDRLSAVSKEYNSCTFSTINTCRKDQLPILSQFYRSMNPIELKWLIRIILRREIRPDIYMLIQEMRVGATEKTFLDCWHPDADKLFNVTSSLSKVCWDLPDPNVRLEDKVPPSKTLEI
jgi:DNA ligase 4